MIKTQLWTSIHVKEAENSEGGMKNIDDIHFGTDKYIFITVYISYNSVYRVFIAYTMLNKPSISDRN
jgi:hypothetical protein